MNDRYSTSGNPEGEYQPGSSDKVLKNRLGIASPEDMDQVELDLLEQLYDAVIPDLSPDQTISTAELCEWHRMWLGNVYEWAGRQRSVNMGKEDFEFAAAHLIPKLLDDLDNKYLSEHTPCVGYGEDKLAEAIAIVHVEFILVHPFREGNGRLARLLANVMALQAGWPELDFSALDQNREYYFASIQAGVGGDYSHLTRLIKQVLRDSVNASSE